MANGFTQFRMKFLERFVGQKYLIDRMLVGVFQRHPSISFFQTRLIEHG